MRDLIIESINHARFDETKRIQELIQYSIARNEEAINSNGHGLAMDYAAGGISSFAALNASMFGIKKLRGIKSIINKYGIENIGNHEQKLISYAYDKLQKIDGVNIFGKNKNKAGVISFTMDCAHSHDIATIIDREGVAVRAGHHCAQPLLDHFNLSSTTRASVGAYSTYEDFDRLVLSLEKVKKIFK